MGNHFNCCNIDHKDDTHIKKEELDLENNTYYSSRNANNINIETKQDKLMVDMSQSLNTQEKIEEFVQSPKNYNTNREMLVQHLQKASGRLEEIKDEAFLENIENFDPQECPKLKIYMTSIYDLNSEPRILNINFLGLENSVRRGNDGVAFFGSINMDENNDNLNSLDIILNFLHLNDERAL
jgi:hypothetical protein